MVYQVNRRLFGNDQFNESNIASLKVQAVIDEVHGVRLCLCFANSIKNRHSVPFPSSANYTIHLQCETNFYQEAFIVDFGRMFQNVTFFITFLNWHFCASFGWESTDGVGLLGVSPLKFSVRKKNNLAKCVTFFIFSSESRIDAAGRGFREHGVSAV